MKSVITAMEDDAVVRHGQKLYERNFVADGTDVTDIGEGMAWTLGKAVGIDVSGLELVESAFEIVSTERMRRVGVDNLAELIWRSFFTAALAGRTATGEDRSTDLLGHTVRVGDVLAYSWAGLDGVSHISFGLVDGLRSNDLIHDVATMKYAKNGAYIGQSSGTARVAQSLLARR